MEAGGQTGWESEKEKTGECGPPGLDADTGEGLLRGGEGGHMAAWQSGTHGEAAGTLACMGPSIASSALRFAGRSGTLTMTSGSPTSVIAPGSQTTRLAKGQEKEGNKKKERKITCSTV